MQVSTSGDVFPLLVFTYDVLVSLAMDGIESGLIMKLILGQESQYEILTYHHVLPQGPAC